MSLKDFVKDFHIRNTRGIKVLRRAHLGATTEIGTLYCNSKANPPLVVAVNGSIEYIPIKDVNVSTHFHAPMGAVTPQWYMGEGDLEAYRTWKSMKIGAEIMGAELTFDAAAIPTYRIRYEASETCLMHQGEVIVGFLAFGEIPQHIYSDSRSSGFLITDKGTSIFHSDWRHAPTLRGLKATIVTE